MKINAQRAGRTAIALCVFAQAGSALAAQPQITHTFASPVQMGVEDTPDPHGKDPHGKDPHDEIHDQALPANATKAPMLDKDAYYKMPYGDQDDRRER